jgi:hypothetical protein
MTQRHGNFVAIVDCGLAQYQTNSKCKENFIRIAQPVKEWNHNKLYVWSYLKNKY